MKKKNKIIGLIGGMGPYASAYFYKLLLDKSRDKYGAKDNDDYPEILIDSIPVPDFISETKKIDVARKMLSQRVKRMADYGVNCIGMVCNTGHLLADDLLTDSRTEFVSMIDSVAERAREMGLKKVGILATPITIKSGLYKKALNKVKVAGVDPSFEMQKVHEQIIRQVIAGRINSGQSIRLSRETRKFIKEHKLDGIILGCTELPLVFPKSNFENVIDCMEVLAEKLLDKYYN